MASFFGIKCHLLDKGYIYIENKRVDVSRGTNYIKVDLKMKMFGLVSAGAAASSQQECEMNETVFTNF